MKFLIAFAFVALATAVPVPEVPAPILLQEPGFMAISIQPLIISPEIADEFFRSFADNPALETRDVLPVNFVDVAENVEAAPQVVKVVQPSPIILGQVPDAMLRKPVTFEAPEVAEEIVPAPVNFVDAAENAEAPLKFEVAAEEIIPEPVNFVDVAENVDAAPLSEVAAEEVQPTPVKFVDVAENVDTAPLSEVAAEEIIPEPVNFVDVAENVEAAPLSEVAAEEVQPTPVKLVDVAENLVAAPLSEVAAEEIQPSPVHVVDAPVDFGDMSALMR